MEPRVFTALGRIAGIGGIAFGFFFFLFKNILSQNLMPKAGLSADNAYHIVLALMVLTFGMGCLGIIAYIVGSGDKQDKEANPHKQVSHAALISISVLTIFILLVSAAVGLDFNSYFSRSATSVLDPTLEAGGTCLNGTWYMYQRTESSLKEKDPLREWHISVTADTLTGQLNNNAAKFTLKKSGPSWTGDIDWGGGNVWSNFTIQTTGDCSKIFTKNGYYFVRQD